MTEQARRGRRDPLGAAALRLLRDQGPVTKADLAELAGVSRSTITAELRHLSETGIVEDGETTPSTGGRRSTTVRLSSGVRLLGIAVGHRLVHLAVTDAQLEPLRVVTIDRARGLGLAEETARLSTAVTSLLGDLGVTRPHAVGLASPVSAAGQPEAAGLSGALGYRTVVGRAASAMVLGERHAGSGRGCRDLVAVRVGATITTASIVDGRLLEGGSGLAGDLGHVRVASDGPVCGIGHRGCLDAFASSTAMLREATIAARAGRSASLAAALARRPLVPDDLVDAIAARDDAAVEIVQVAGAHLGAALGGLIAFTNPDRVLLGGSLAVLGPEFLASVRASAYRSAPAPLSAGLRIELGQPDGQSGVIGAAFLASEDLFDRVGRPAGGVNF